MKNAYIKFILAAVIFGTNGIIASHIPLSSYEIVLTRTVLGGFFLLILATARREWGSLRRASRTSLVWLVLSGLFLSGNWLFLYEAYQHIGVSLATLMCYCGPILIMILSYFVFHEPFTVPKVSAMVIVTIGILCINGADVQAHGLSWGLVCGFLSAVCFALLVIAMKKVSGIGGILSPACQLLVASLVVAAVTLSMRRHRSAWIRPTLPAWSAWASSTPASATTSIFPASSACRPRASLSVATWSPLRPWPCRPSSSAKA